MAVIARLCFKSILQPEGEDELKRKQLMELAIINGTFRPATAAAAAAAAAAAGAQPRIICPAGLVPVPLAGLPAAAFSHAMPAGGVAPLGSPLRSPQMAVASNGQLIFHSPTRAVPVNVAAAAHLNAIAATPQAQGAPFGSPMQQAVGVGAGSLFPGDFGTPPSHAAANGTAGANELLHTALGLNAPGMLGYGLFESLSAAGGVCGAAANASADCANGSDASAAGAFYRALDK